MKRPPMERSSLKRLLGWAAILWLGSALPCVAQGPRIVAAIEPDSVQVGEAFTVGLTVTQGTSGEVQFPATLVLGDDLEQRGPVRIRSEDGGSVWRAYYTIVAWTADTIAIPPVELTSSATGNATLSVTPPSIVVSSILPPDVSEFELREAKPFLRVRAFPWWVLLLFASLAAGVWWWWRGRTAPVLAGVRGPAGDALREFERLRDEWLGGRLTGDGFYDRFESTLRRYARATRGWAPSQTVFGLGREDTSLLAELRRSLIVRFARVRAAADGPLSALDAGEGFVRSEMPSETMEEHGDPQEVVAGPGEASFAPGADDPAGEEDA